MPERFIEGDGSVGLLGWPTVAELGNVGSVSLPASFSLAEEAGFIEHGQRVGLLGIGSGLNCRMLGVAW